MKEKACLKNILKKIFFLPAIPTLIIAIPSFAFVSMALDGKIQSHILIQCAYFLSAYSLAITLTFIIRLLKRLDFDKSKIPFLSFLDDMEFKSKLLLSKGLAINFLYAILKLALGLYYRSFWFISFSLYYIYLCCMRILLLKKVVKIGIGSDLEKELKTYRLCGILFILIDLAFSFIVNHMIGEGRAPIYPANLIYVMALYTFYVTIAAIVNIFKNSGSKSPIVSVSKIVALVTSLVSMQSLESAMLLEFGNDEQFRDRMLAISGLAIFLIVFFISLYMIASSTIKLKNLPSANDGRLEENGLS